MSTRMVHILAVLALALLVVAFETGLMAAGNAFFGVSAVLVLLTTYKLLPFDGKTPGEALRSIFSRPTERRSHAYGFFAYVGIAAVGLIVAVQAVTTV